MRKIRIIIMMLFVVLIAFCCVRFFSKGYEITYKLKDKNEFEITEVYTRNIKNEKDNYYIEITVGKTTYSYQFFKDFEKRKVVTDILYYKGEIYECLLPLIEDEVLTDFTCYKGTRFYNYAHIRGNDKKLDEYIDGLDTAYNLDRWLNQSDVTIDYDGVYLYKENAISEHHVIISNLKGVFSVTDTIKNTNVFSKDIYSRPLSSIVGKYYITADYEENRHFRTFYFVNIVTGKVKTQKAPEFISFDSYIQGVIEDKLYLYDRDNEVQYEIDVENTTITEVGNKRKEIKYYKNGEWTTISTTKANKTLLFDETIVDKDFKNFEAIYLHGNELSGYYYLFAETKGGYAVSRAPVQNKKAIMYLFTVDSIDDIRVIDEYVYYRVGNKINYYSDLTGVKTIIRYDELEFNDNLIFGAYK